MKRTNSGFTLVEAMVVIAVLTILLAVGVPSYQQFRDDTELSSAAFALYTDIQLARTEAVKRGSDNLHIFFFNDTSGWCYRITDKTRSDCSSCAATASQCDIGADGILRGNDQSHYPRTTLATKFDSTTDQFINITNRRAGLTLGTISSSANPTDGVISFSVNGKTVNVNPSPIGSVLVCTKVGSSLTGIESCSS